MLVTFPLFVPMVCRNICERIYSKIVVGQSHYFVGKKYCRRCECHFITKKIFCQCCGMQLRTTPAERECKENMNRSECGVLGICKITYQEDVLLKIRQVSVNIIEESNRIRVQVDAIAPIG